MLPTFDQLTREELKDLQAQFFCQIYECKEKIRAKSHRLKARLEKRKLVLKERTPLQEQLDRAREVLAILQELGATDTVLIQQKTVDHAEAILKAFDRRKRVISTYDAYREQGRIDQLIDSLPRIEANLAEIKALLAPKVVQLTSTEPTEAIVVPVTTSQHAVATPALVPSVAGATNPNGFQEIPIADQPKPAEASVERPDLQRVAAVV
ncbi:MAG: hypothetical protein ACFB10_13190 [Salibacteraceae bacterium]